jgi:transcriptional regulator with XRE-family HTH domain
MEDKRKINWDELGKLIYQRRKEKNLNQSQLAGLVNLYQPIISLAERGSPVGITDEKLELILDTLEITKEDLPRIETVEKKVTSKRKKIFKTFGEKRIN